MGLCMLFTEEQIQRLNICNLMNCKINRGNIIEEELNQFIFNVRNKICSELPTDEMEMSNERYIQAFEVETLLNMRENVWGISGIDDILAYFSTRLCTTDGLVNNMTRMKELAVLSSICKNWNLVPSNLHSVVEKLLDDNNEIPLYSSGNSVNR